MVGDFAQTQDRRCLFVDLLISADGGDVEDVEFVRLEKDEGAC